MKQIAGLVAAAATTTTWAVGHQWRSVRERLARKNFRGEDVTLIEGPAVVAGLSAAALVHPALGVAALSAGCCGLIDDLAGSGDRRGLKGHLGALGHGEITTGALKIVGIGVTGAVVAAAIDRGNYGALRTPLAALMIAGSANLINLFDLRPGRALKVSTLACAPLLLVEPAAALVPLATAAVVAPADLAGLAMMGDTGANALGAVIAAGWARNWGSAARLACTTAVIGLTLASEKVSFSAVIADSPVLRAIDEWGRRTVTAP